MYISKNKVPNALFLVLFLISMSLLTYDKLPFLRYSSYSPSSIFTFAICFIIVLITGLRIYKYDKFLILFIFISIVHSMLSGIYYKDINSSFKHIITLFVGMTVYFSTRHAFSNKKYKYLYEKILIASLIVPIILGFLQLLNQIGLNIEIVNKVTSLFSFYVYPKRIQMASSEPSWASIHLLTVSSIFLFNSTTSRKQKIMLSLCLVLFLFIFSSYGYGVLIFSLILFGLITKKSRIKVILFMFIFGLIVFKIVPLIIDIFNVQGYFNNRFDIKYLFSKDFLSEDASGFIRIIFPIIGLMEFIHFPFGYGGGFYYVHFNDYLIQHFSFGLNFAEVQQNYLQPQISATARNLFSKILSEEGIIQFIIFIFFLKGIFKQCKTNYGKYVLCLALAFMLNFDSYAYVNFWFLLGVISSGYFDNKEKYLINDKKYRIVWK